MTDESLNQKRVKLKVLNKHFAAMWDGGSPRIIPNPYEMAKQWCLLNAKGVSVELPYFPYCPDSAFREDFPDLFAWRDALGHQNPPSRVDFRSDPERFRQLVEPLDFSKPYNAAAVDAIHSAFATGHKSSEIDATDLITAELEHD